MERNHIERNHIERIHIDHNHMERSHIERNPIEPATRSVATVQLAPAPSAPSDPTHILTGLDLSAVAVDDQLLVRNVCVILAAMRRDVAAQNITVATAPRGYVVTAAFAPGAAVEVSKAELDTLAEVNSLRVANVSVMHDGERMRIKVGICGCDFPITVTDTAVVQIVKKRRWFM